MSWGVLGSSSRAFAVGAAIVLAAGLSACGATSAPEETPQETSQGAAPTSPAATPTPEASWVTYTTQDHLASWEMPSDWAASFDGVDESGLIRYTVAAPDDHVHVDFTERVTGLGGPGCLPDVNPPYPYTTLDTVDIPIAVVSSDWEGAVPPRTAYEIIEFPDHVAAGLGDTTSVQGYEGEACWFDYYLPTLSAAGLVSFSASYPDATSPSGWGDQSFATVADARGYIETPEYATLTRILSSLRIDDSPGLGDGVYDLSETAECGMFDLYGQTLTIAGTTASITTPGQVLTGHVTQTGTQWTVSVTAAGADRTTVELVGTASGGLFQGSGEYGGINPSGETGWDCVVPSFTATRR